MASSGCVFVVFLQVSLGLAVRQFLMFDFNDNDNVTDWRELSDTSKKSGMSKAAFVLLETELLRRAVLFTLLNAQVKGGGFAGIETSKQLDLSEYGRIALRVRGQGKNKIYKVVLKHNSSKSDDLEYCHVFEAPFEDYNVIKLPLNQFKPYYKNKLVNQTSPLRLNEISKVGIQMYGGDSSQKKQAGVSSLEIDWIIALG